MSQLDKSEVQQKMFDKFMINVYTLDYVYRSADIIKHLHINGKANASLDITKSMGSKILNHLLDETASLGSFIVDNVFDELKQEDQEIFLRSTEVLATIMSELDTKEKSDVSYPQTNQQVH